MASLAADLPADILRSHQRPSRYHRVRRGETVSRIARLYGVRVRDIIRMNTLDRRGTIYAGQRLRLPGGAGGGVPVITVAAKTAPAKARLRVAALAPPPALRPAGPVSPVVPAAPVVEAPAPLPAIAARAAMAMAVSHLPRGLDSPPSSWNLPRSERFYQAALAAAGPEEKLLNSVEVADDLSVEAAGDYGVIRVAAAETLGHYAQWLGVPTSRLRRLNRLRYGEAIHVNQRLRIPLPPDRARSFVEKRYEYHRELLEDFFASWRIEKLEPYRLRPGDSIWTLCSRKFDLPFWLLYRFNRGLDPERMRPRQEILVPVVVKREVKYAGAYGGGSA